MVNRFWWMKSLIGLVFLGQNLQAATIGGRVLDYGGTAVNGATVMLASAGAQTTTDTNGLFSLSTSGIEESLSGSKPHHQKRFSISNGMLSILFPQGINEANLRAYSLNGRVVAQKRIRGTGRMTIPLEKIIGSAGDIKLLTLSLGDRSYFMKVLRAGASSTQIARVEDSRNTSRTSKTMVAAIDTIVISKSGFNTKRLAVDSYDADLGDITIIMVALPQTFKLITPLSLQTQGGLGKRNDLASDVSTQTCGQEVVKMAIFEIEDQTKKVSELFAMIDNVLEDVDPAKIAWVTGSTTQVEKEDLDKIIAIEGKDSADVLTIAEGEEYNLPPFIFADSAHISAVVDSLNAWKPGNVPQITVETTGFDGLLVLFNTSAPGADPVMGDRIGLTFILWTYDRSRVRVKNWDRMDNSEVFQIEFNYNAETKVSDLFYNYYFSADWSNPNIDTSHVLISMTMKETDSTLHGSVFDFAFQKILGDVGHDFQFFVRGFADDSGGYAELKRRYNPNINSTSFSKGLAEFGRSREQFGSDAAISSRKGFSTETASSIDDWFVIPNTGDWDDSDPHIAAFDSGFTSDFQTLAGGYQSYSPSSRNFVSVKAPADLSFTATEFNKLFVVTRPDADPLVWANVIGSFVVDQGEYIKDSTDFVQTVFVYNMPQGLPDSLDIHEATDFTDTTIVAVTTTQVAKNDSAGVFE